MAIGDPYITRDQLKGILDIELANTDEDVLIDRAIKGAARSIERRSGWPTFWKTTAAEARTIDVTRKVVRVRTAGWIYDKVLLRNGIASATGFLVTGYTSPVLMPEDAIAEGLPADAIRLPGGGSYGNFGSLVVTAQWGWPSVPDDIVMANQMQAHRYYDRKGSPEGIAGSAEWGITRIPPLDPDVLSILKGGGFMRAGIG
jgi:hypothetical protein